MKLRIVSVVAATVLVYGTTAEAKGPSELMVTGAGVNRPIVVASEDDSWSRIANESAFFDAMFSTQTFDGAGFARARTSPALNDLGSRLRLTWTVHWDKDHHLVQDLYPDAPGGPLLYTPAGQALYDRTTAGGWYRAPSRFVDALEAAGVPSPAELDKANIGVSAYLRSTGSGIIARW